MRRRIAEILVTIVSAMALLAAVWFVAGCGPMNVASPTSQPYIVVNVQVGSASQPAVVVTVSGHVFAKEPATRPTTNNQRSCK